MDLYTAERLHVERQREIAEVAERHARLVPQMRERPLRVWVASRLRRMADRLDRPSRLQRVV